MSHAWHWIAVVSLAIGVDVAAAQQECTGRGDLDADGRVGFADLGALGCCMAGPEASPSCDPAVVERADLESDGDVDLVDVAALCQLVGRRYFDYGLHRANLEAEMLAMDVSGQLRAPDAEYERILGDLAKIRAEYPELVDVVDDPDYAPNRLIVSLIAGQPLEEYEALNAYYLLSERRLLFGTWWVLTFCDNLNANELGPMYADLAAVQYAEPDSMVGTDDRITVAALGERYRYEIDDGFWDCFDGCDCHRLWVIEVSSAGVVTLVSYEEYGMSWCEFK